MMRSRRGSARRGWVWSLASGLLACAAELDLGAVPPCGDGGTACITAASRACVDLQRDPRHCGACGRACEGEGACARGVCCGSPACAGRCMGTRWELREGSAGREALGYYALDLDADGHTDLVSVDQLDATLHVFWGTGEAALGLPAVWNVGRINGDVAFGDLNGDGALDLVAAVQSRRVGVPDAIGVMLRARGRAAPKVALLPETGQPDEVALLDVDADGRLDLLTRRMADGCLLLRRGDGAGMLAPGRCITTLAAGPDAILPFTRLRLDDGRDGLVVSAPASRTLLRFAADGTVTPSEVLADAPGPFATLAHDFDGDGVEDLLSVRQPQPNGAFVVEAFRVRDGRSTPLGCTTPGTADMRPLAVADFDEDGRLDLAGYRRINNAPWITQVHFRR
jgi:hypothetical protein